MAKTVDIPVERESALREPPASYFVPATDIYETPDELVLAAEMPGVKADGMDVTVEDSVLVLRGRPRAEPETRGGVLLKEFASGEYYRAFQLPADFDTARIQATLKQGVLTLRLPKSERMKPKRIEVKVE